MLHMDPVTQPNLLHMSQRLNDLYAGNVMG